MSQSDVLAWLKSHPNHWWRSLEIAKSLKASTARVINNLSKLRRTNFMKWKLSANSKNKQCYWYKYVK